MQNHTLIRFLTDVSFFYCYFTTCQCCLVTTVPSAFVSAEHIAIHVTWPWLRYMYDLGPHITEIWFEKIKFLCPHSPERNGPMSLQYCLSYFPICCCITLTLQIRLNQWNLWSSLEYLCLFQKSNGVLWNHNLSQFSIIFHTFQQPCCVT